MAKIMVVIGFLVAFAAGLTVGLEARRTTAADVVEPVAVAARPATTQSTSGPATRQSRPSGWIVSQLNLNADQQKKMDKIWSEVARGGREEMEKRRHQFRKDRDEAILALIRPEDKPAYEAILKKYQDDQRNMEREMRARFEKAVEETNALLTPEQREKYKDLLNRHRPPDRDRDDDRRREGDRGGDPGGDRDRNSREGERRGDRDRNEDAHAKRDGRNLDGARLSGAEDDDNKRKTDNCEQAQRPCVARDAGNCARS